MTELNAKITDVTIYKDSALITKKIQTKLQKGKHSLLVCNLPDKANENSVRVKVSNSAFLRDMKIQKFYQQEISDEKINKTKNKIQQDNERVELLKAILTNIESEKNTLDLLITKTTTSNNNTQSFELKSDSWFELLKYYREENVRLDTEILKINSEIKELTNKNYLDPKWKTTKSAAVPINKVEINIETFEDSEITIEISYLISEVNWNVNYDFRIDSEKDKMKVTYFAQINQKTSEDWTDVNLTLSTAKINQQNKYPTSKPKQITGYKVERNDKTIYNNTDNIDWTLYYPELASCDDCDEMDIPSRNIEGGKSKPESIPKKKFMKQEASVSTKLGSVEFNIKTKNSILCDNQVHKLTIKTLELPLKYQYISMPAWKSQSFLEIEATNNSKYPFLPGKANLFYNNAFVATNSFYNEISPAQKFKLEIGVDDKISVLYKEVSVKTVDSGGLIKKKKDIHEYEIIIENLKNSEINSIIRHQLPIPGYSEIDLKIIEPTFDEKTSDVKKLDFNGMEWNFNLAAKETKILSLKYEIEYPHDWELWKP